MLMKSILVLLCGIILLGCADEQKRYEYLKEKYPHLQISATTHLDADFEMEDTTTHKVIGVSFYPFRERKVFQFIVIR